MSTQLSCIWQIFHLSTTSFAYHYWTFRFFVWEGKFLFFNKAFFLNALRIAMNFDHSHPPLLTPPRPTPVSITPTQPSVSFYFLSNQLSPVFAPINSWVRDQPLEHGWIQKTDCPSARNHQLSSAPQLGSLLPPCKNVDLLGLVCRAVCSWMHVPCPKDTLL